MLHRSSFGNREKWKINKQLLAFFYFSKFWVKFKSNQIRFFFEKNQISNQIRKFEFFLRTLVQNTTESLLCRGIRDSLVVTTINVGFKRKER